MKARAILFPRPNEVELQAIELPAIGPNEVLAETIHTFVSPGAELRVLGGQAESKGRFPLIPGYAWVDRPGTVSALAFQWSE